MTRKRPTAIGAYIFAGGFTLGVKEHFDVACHLEETSYGVATARQNFPDLPIYHGPERWPLDELREHEWDLVYGNPPCAAWSANGRNVGDRAENWRTDPRVECTRKHFDLLRKLRPRAWVWESVPQALTKGRDLVDDLATEAVGLGYSVTYLIHDAQWLGVPQKRKRFFFVAHKMAVAWPTPNWAPSKTPLEALDGIVPRGGPAFDTAAGMRWTDKLAMLAPGERLYKLFERLNPEDTWERGSWGQVKGRPSFGQVRLPVDRVGPATVGYAMVHPTEHRWLTINEVQALASFPDDWEFVSEGNRKIGDADRLDLIARGVCPGVAEWLARAVSNSLRGTDAAEPVVRTIDLSEPPPENDAAREQSVKKKIVVLDEQGKNKAMAADKKMTRHLPHPAEGVRSGAYIRELLSVGGYEREQIAEAVRRHYPGSVATVRDVDFHRYRMRKAGTSQAVVATKKITAVPDARQPLRTGERKSNDPDREFDRTSLRAGAHGKWVHRDYGAHFFRWGFAGRFVNGETEVLDVGCGPDVPMIDALTMPRNQVPKRYVGVDLNREPRSPPSRQWATLRWEFNFLERHKELGQHDLVACFEVIEHMRRSDGVRLLAALGKCLRPEGRLLLSTPVFNGKAAANHLHEWTASELSQEIDAAKMVVEARYGTFASQRDIKRAALSAELDVFDRLSRYYSGEVLSCFLAPLYPDASRNCVWVVKRRTR